MITAVVLLGCRPESNEPCTVMPTELHFGEVQSRRGAVYERFVTVRNPSSVDRLVTAQQLSFPFSVPDIPVLVKARSEALIPIRFGAFDGRLHHDELVLSDEDGSCSFNIPVSALGSGMVRVSPDKLEFTLGAGEVETQELLVENTRRTPVTVELEWHTAEGAPVPLSFGVSPLTLPPGSSTMVPITAAPQGWDRISAVLLVTEDSAQLMVPVTIHPSSPRLEITPKLIELPVVGLDPGSQPAAFAERSIRVRNTGTTGNPEAPPLWLVANDPFLGNPSELHVTTPPLPLALAEGESAEIKVRLIPRFSGVKSFGVMISTDRFGTSQVRLSTVAEVLPPCTLRVDPVGEVQLSDALDGGLEGRVTFTNEGAERCVVDNLRLREGTPFTLASGGQPQVEIAAGRAHSVTIAGPKSVDAGVVGAFGFHVFRTNGDDEWLELRAP